MGMILLGSSCKKYLDINTNPNTATLTTATPELIMPQVLTGMANVVNTYNSYGSQLGGYGANAGGYGGFGTAISYNFASSDYQNNWTASYDNLEDFQTVINLSAPKMPAYGYFSGAAKIMKAYGFQLLVDAYNNIPYSEALQGADKLTPVYTDATKIYAGLASLLDTAIKEINTAQGVTNGTVIPMTTQDVIFKGDMNKWKQFANTIKLRLIVRGTGKTTFANTTFDPAGFLSTDVLINPGFTRDNGRQNPAWNNWGYAYTGGDATKSWVPSTFIFGFYDGHKILDTLRGKATYYQFPNTGTNQLGHESVDNPKCPPGSYWYIGTTRAGTSAGNSKGILKGPNAGFPIMLAAESYFLQSEAAVRGIVNGDAKALFNSGIVASYNYLYQLPDGSVSGNPTADVTKYQADNPSNYLVNFSLASGASQQVEAIITQKYIALNWINGQESWNEYRRTGYPATTYAAVPDPHQTFASTVSEQPSRPDKLPTRILYPPTEGSYNPTNVPKNISPFTSLIFWAK